MSDDNTATQPQATPPREALPPVTVTLEIPGRLHRDYTMLTELGLFVSVQEAVRQELLTGWRFSRGSFHSLRLDTDAEAEKVEGSDKAEDSEKTNQD